MIHLTDEQATIVDETDFSILCAVKQHDLPPWKNKIHGWIVEEEGTLPIAGVSVQTVGRRVDDLVQEDYLETVIVSPDDIKRDLIIAFKLTDKGHETINETREHLLANRVKDHLFRDTDTGMQNGTIARLIADRYGWDTDALNEMREQYGTEELSSFLTLIYVDEQTGGMLDGVSERTIEELAATTDDAQSALSIEPAQ